ncbi:hypothetical protein AOLI_G00014720 [Acnodon oligacanthus]
MSPPEPGAAPPRQPPRRPSARPSSRDGASAGRTGASPALRRSGATAPCLRPVTEHVFRWAVSRFTSGATLASGSALARSACYRVTVRLNGREACTSPANELPVSAAADWSSTCPTASALRVALDS